MPPLPEKFLRKLILVTPSFKKNNTISHFNFQNADNPDEIDIDDDEDDEEGGADDDDEEVEQVPEGLEKQTVPSQVFGGLKPTEDDDDD